MVFVNEIERQLWFVSCQFPATPFCKLQQIKEILCIFTKCQNNLAFIFLNEYMTFQPESFTCTQISKIILSKKCSAEKTIFLCPANMYIKSVYRIS